MNRRLSKKQRFVMLVNRPLWFVGKPAVGCRLTLPVVFLLMFFLLALSPGFGTAQAMSRYELGRVIETIPPNGPFWKYGNVVMQSRTRAAGVKPVVFSHWSHRPLYTCRVCHVELGFTMKAGGSGITRNQYLSGAFCGACHDGQTAFSARKVKGSECDRCHLKDTTELEKRFETFAAVFPVAHFGNGIDWAQAQRDWSINQLSSLRASTVIMPLPEKLKQPLKLGTSSPRSGVFFSHEEHFAELDCSNCHPDLFTIKQSGTQTFSMERNIFGNFCGACHMLVAFPMNDCRRCHPQMNYTTKP